MDGTRAAQEAAADLSAELSRSQHELRSLKSDRAGEREDAAHAAQMSWWSTLLAFGMMVVVVAFAMFLAAEMAVHREIKIGTAMFALFLVASAVPVTYAVGGHMRYAQGGGWRFFQPGNGGARFVVFQGMSWTFFALTLLLPFVPWAMAFYYPTIVFKGFIISAGATGILSQVLMVSSLLLFRRSNKGDGEDARRRRARSGSASEEADVVMGPSRKTSMMTKFLVSKAGDAWWKTFVGMQVVLALVACALTVVADILRSDSSGWIVTAVLSIVCMSLAVMLTHGVAGRWRHYYRRWSFYQPLTGGLVFVVFQALSWTFFATAIIVFALQLAGALSRVYGFAAAVDMLPLPRALLENPPALMTAGLAGLLAELIMATSLAFYQDDQDSRGSRDGRDGDSVATTVIHHGDDGDSVATTDGGGNGSDTAGGSGGGGGHGGGGGGGHGGHGGGGGSGGEEGEAPEPGTITDMVPDYKESEGVFAKFRRVRPNPRDGG
jgi:uncharacterized membrane protein YgcG